MLSKTIIRELKAMERLTGDDFKWRSNAVSKIKALSKGNKFTYQRLIETEVGANTLHLLQVLDGVLEELIEQGIVTEVVAGIVYFAHGG